MTAVRQQTECRACEALPAPVMRTNIVAVSSSICISGQMPLRPAYQPGLQSFCLKNVNFRLAREKFGIKMPSFSMPATEDAHSMFNVHVRYATACSSQEQPDSFDDHLGRSA